MTTAEILFYFDLALVIVALIDAAGVFVLARKTAYRRLAGIITLGIAAVAFAAYIVQLVMFSCALAGAEIYIYVASGMLAAELIAVSVYCFLLYKRADRARCIVTGVLQYFQPAGAIAMMALAIRARRDTRGENLVYTGYAFTYAALGAYATKFKTDFVDSAETAEYEPLDKKAAAAKLKAAKKNTRTPEGKFEYGVLLSHYAPKKMRRAFKLFAQAAKRDHSAALFNLGYCYETGLYVSKNLKRAAELYKRAAALGDGDAELRLAIVDIRTGKPERGIEIFDKRMADRDLCAEFDRALCVERGLGIEKNVVAAMKSMFKCADLGFFIAQQHIFELAVTSLGVPERDVLFGMIEKHSFVGAFDNMIKGVAALRDKRARDASKLFLSAVKLRGKWEGMARLLVGTLYLDSGELDEDKRNGAAYVKSAIGMVPIAKDIYATVPKEWKAIKNVMNK